MTERPPPQDRDLLDTVLRQLPVGVVAVDARTGEVVTTNEQVERILGTHPSTVEELPLSTALRAGELVGGERTVWLRPGGEERLLEVSAAPIRDPSGAIVAAVTVFQDVTRRELRERAEREFVTNAAHELQTPLTAITSAVEVLMAGAKEIPADRDRFLTHIQAETDRLARLVRSLLVLARVQTGADPPPPERVELRPVLDEAALALSPAAGVEVRVRCPAGLAAYANRSLVEQALLNVAANAAKYTQEGSIRLGARRSGRLVLVDVADTGPGVPAEEEEQVFERFYRVGGRARDGFGLGLAIAREAVRAAGGEIRLQPARSGGTVVQIRLPADAA